jgi:hypothetical protein
MSAFNSRFLIHPRKCCMLTAADISIKLLYVQTSHSFKVAMLNSDTLTKLIEISCVGLPVVLHILAPHCSCET